MAAQNLAQLNPSANTDTDLYTVPSGKEIAISSLIVCETSAVACTYDISHRVGGAALATKHRIAKAVGLGASGSDPWLAGVTATAGDVITVRASHANVAFNLYGIIRAITP